MFVCFLASSPSPCTNADAMQQPAGISRVELAVCLTRRQGFDDLGTAGGSCPLGLSELLSIWLVQPWQPRLSECLGPEVNLSSPQIGLIAVTLILNHPSLARTTSTP